LIKINNGKQSLNSDGQQFYQHLQSEQPTVTLPQTWFGLVWFGLWCLMPHATIRNDFMIKYNK
jgi:tryptophan-rich sensory protein